MTTTARAVLFLMCPPLLAHAQPSMELHEPTRCAFQEGDDPRWAQPDFDDAAWTKPPLCMSSFTRPCVCSIGSSIRQEKSLILLHRRHTYVEVTTDVWGLCICADAVLRNKGRTGPS
jgi:hypothetical protein